MCIRDRSASGLVEHTVGIRLSQQKIDDLNTKVLASVDGALADALAELSKASAEVASGKQELADGKAKLEAQQSQTADALAQTSAQVDAAVAQLESVNANVTNLTASQKALEAEKAGICLLYTSSRDELHGRGCHDQQHRPGPRARGPDGQLQPVHRFQQIRSDF